MKWCTKCFHLLPRSAFWRHKGNRDGRAYHCKDCSSTTHPKVLARIRDTAYLLTQGLKRCTKCKKVKPLDKFHQNHRNADGRVPQCRSCLSPRAVDRERLRKQGFKHCPSCKQIKPLKEFYLRTNGKPMSACKSCFSVRRAIYYRKNSERAYAAGRAWMKANPEKRRQYLENYRAYKNQAPGTWVAEDVTAMWAAQNGICIYCKTDLPSNYHVDHVIPLSRGGDNWPSNLQLLCPSCNISKRTRTHEEYLAYRERLKA